MDETLSEQNSKSHHLKVDENTKTFVTPFRKKKRETEKKDKASRASGDENIHLLVFLKKNPNYCNFVVLWRKLDENITKENRTEDETSNPNEINEMTEKRWKTRNKMLLMYLIFLKWVKHQLQDILKEEKIIFTCDFSMKEWTKKNKEHYWILKKKQVSEKLDINKKRKTRVGNKLSLTRSMCCRQNKF